MQPPDLRVQAPAGPTAGQSFAQGYDTGVGITGVANAAADRDTALKQAEIGRQQAIALQTDMQAVANNPNPSAGDYARLITKYPQLADKFKAGWDVLNKDQQDAKVQSVAPVFAAVKAGNPKLATKLMDDHITGMQNSGAPQKDIAAATAWRGVLEANPAFAMHNMGLMLASTLGAEKFQGMFSEAGKERRADELQPTELAKNVAGTVNTLASADKTTAEAGEVAANAAAQRSNISSEIATRAENLALGRDKLESEIGVKLKEIEQKAGNLPESARKIVNDSVTQATISRNTANQARGLADQFEKTDVASGLTGNIREKFKQITGNENYITQLRNEYSKIRATAVRAGIPAGPASDKDVAFASKGFLSDTADAKQIASFLRGMAGMQDYNSRYENIRAEWAGAVGHLGKTNKDIDIDGTKVPAGYTLDDFAKMRLEQPLPVNAPAPGGETGYLKKYETHGVTAPKG